jgi:serine protease Do
MRNHLTKKIILSVVLPLALLACSKPNQAQITPQPAVAQKPASLAPLTQLPDFSSLVDKEGPAVVNISSNQTVRSQGMMPQFPGMSPDDPFYEFFRRFMPPPQQQGPREFHTQSLGSGFIISDDGYILTNAHVVDGADEVTVKLTDKREFKAKVIGSDKRADVALIKIDAKGLPKVALGNSSRLRVGEWVVAIGSPFGFDNSVTAGIVSAIGRSLPDENYVPFIQTDVAINPGNSGGPLFNLKGEVVGINSQIYSRSGGYMGLSFAIPIDVAMDITNQLRSHGKVSRGKLGVGIQQLTQELATSFGLSNASGALVTLVEKGSPAEKAGVEVGDVILKYDGKPVAGSNELPPMVAVTKPGTTVKLAVWRKGKTRELDVTVGELPGEKTAQRGNDATPGSNRLGLALSELTAEQKQQSGVDHGLLVQAVRGTAAKAGVRQGDIILALNNTEVATVEQFNKSLAQAAPGRTVALLIQRRGNAIYVPIKIEGE